MRPITLRDDGFDGLRRILSESNLKIILFMLDT